MIYMISAVVLTVGVITFFMVCLDHLPNPSNADCISAIRCLDGRCSIRYRVLQGQGANRRAYGLGCLKRHEDRRGHKGRRGSACPQRAISNEPLDLMFICTLIAGALFFRPGMHLKEFNLIVRRARAVLYLSEVTLARMSNSNPALFMAVVGPRSAYIETCLARRRGCDWVVPTTGTTHSSDADILPST
jgi:hypothetical protein